MVLPSPGMGEKVYVTQFLALKPATDPRPLTQSEGTDDGREGRVTVINADNNDVIDTATQLIANVGAAFLALTPSRASPPRSPQYSTMSGAFPNLLESIVIKGELAYVPGTCSSPNGPFRFNVNVQSCLSSIGTDDDTEAFPTLNMNVGVNFEPPGTRLFNTNPFAIAFKNSSMKDSSPWQRRIGCFA